MTNLSINNGDGTTSSPTSNNSKGLRSRRTKRPQLRRYSKPPSQDRLVIIFISATAIFSLLSISPFLFGNFPSIETNNNKGGIISNLAGNKTALLWHYFMRLQQEQLAENIAKHEYVPMVDNNVIHDADEPLPLSRGVSGLPIEQTPALVGAKHGTITCPDGTTMDRLAYWNEPQGELDVSFVSPFAPTQSSSSESKKERRYVTFEPDRGGWNNIRMSLEIVIVFAAATGRTLVLPPDTPFYLLNKKQVGKKNSRHHGFADFIDLESEALRKKVNMITMKEFLEQEGTTDKGIIPENKMFRIPGGDEGKKIWKSSEQCYYVAKSDRPCETIYNFLISEAYVPELQAGRDCLIFDVDKQSNLDHYSSSEIFDLMPEEEQEKVNEFCTKRSPTFYGGDLASAPLVHFHAGEKTHRLLNHFYTFLYFTDIKVDHYYKRFVRDFLHYTDTIWCAAGKVVRLLEDESMKLTGDDKPIFSSMHVRRGDFQYKKVKITAEDWYDNTKDLFKKNEIIYIATDEKDHSFFKPLEEHWNGRVRFLSNYSEAAGLDKLDPNIMGMIDTIVASRGRLFVGTWFSTFTGYINRMRGYNGMSGITSFYSTPDRKYNTHKWENPEKVLTAREWPTAWIGIDGEKVVAEEQHA